MSLFINLIDVQVAVVTADRQVVLAGTVRNRCAVLLSVLERRNLLAEVTKRAHADFAQIVAYDNVPVLQ